MTRPTPEVIAPLIAAALIAQQVGANAIRDGLLLSLFPVQSLPYFMAGAAVLAIFATPFSDASLSRLGPVRSLRRCSRRTRHSSWLSGGFSAGGLRQRRCSSTCTPPCSEQSRSLRSGRSSTNASTRIRQSRLMARVAGAATFGGLIGGVGAERVAALFPQGTLLPLLGLVGVIPVAGALAIGRGAPAKRSRAEDEPDLGGGWTQIRRQPLLRNLARRYRPRGDARGAR